MQDLLKSYRETLYDLQKVKIRADEARNKAKERFESNNTESNQEDLDVAQDYCDTINSFISNVMYVVSWLSRGHAPNPRRAIHRRSREQREVLMDPLKMQSYANPAGCGSPTTITDSERFRIDEAMCALTPRERDCYMLKYGQCYSEREIARLLATSQQAVHQNIKRAEAKINDSLRNNLFLTIA